MGLIDLDLLEKCAAILKPFKDVTVIMSSETSTTASLIRPLLHQLLTHVKPNADSNDPRIVHQSKAALYHHLELRYTSNTEVLDRCSFLDPRVKVLVFLTEEERKAVGSRVMTMLADNIDARLDSQPVTGPEPTNTDRPIASSSSSLLSSLLGDQYTVMELHK